MKKLTVTRHCLGEVNTRSDGSDQIEVIFTTGYKGMRSEWGEQFFEELEVTPEACNLERLNKGAPFLAQHNQNIQDTIGVVTSAKIENGIGYATIRLSQRDEVRGIVSDIKSGIFKNISVGYSIEEFTDVTKQGESVKTLRATRWTPKEISVVAIGFDPHAQVLRADEDLNEVVIKNKEVKPMTDQEMYEALQAKVQAGEVLSEEEQKQFDELKAKMEPVVTKEEERTAPTQPVIDIAEVGRKAIEEFKKRSEQIHSIVKASGIDKSPEEYVNSSLTIEQISQEIFKTLETNKRSNELNKEKQMDKKQLLSEALLNRMNARKFECSAGNPYKQASLMTIAQEVVERKAGETDTQFAQRAIASADLADLLANVSNKALSEDKQESFSYRKIAKEYPMRDFKSTPIIKFSASGLSNKSSETGDYTDTAATDSSESIQLKDRGALYKISYVALMNDDLGVLKELPSKADEMGGRDIEGQLYAFLNANAALSDTKALFHADHGNILAASAAPSTTTLNSVEQLMAAFKDDSNNPLDMKTKYLVVPPSLAMTAYQVANGALVPNGVSSVNPWAGNIEVIVSSRIAQVGGKDCWFAIAENSPLVFGTLEGQSDKTEVAVENDFNSKNMKIRVTQPSTVGTASYKGIVRVVLV